MKSRRLLMLLSMSVLALVLALSVAVSGCGDDTADTETTAAGTEETAAPSGDVITLKYADQNAEAGWVGQEAANPWLDMIEEATDNQVQIDRYFGQTLMTGIDTWEGLKAGIADLAWCMHQYWAGVTPLAEVLTQAFMPFDSSELNGAVMWQLYEEFPSIKEQFADNRPVAIWTSTPFYLFTVDKQVKSPEDLKGLKIRTHGGPPTQLVEALGGSPVGMPMPDVYQNLQTGVLDGVLAPWEAIYSFRLYEVVKYGTMVPFHTALFGISFNHDSWNGLPADVQAEIEELSGLWGSMFWGKNMFDSAETAVPGIIAEEGYELTLYEPAEDEILSVWQEPYGEPLWGEWVKQMEAEGHTDAQAILDRALELLEEGLPQ